MNPDELIQQAREQLEMADRYATNQPSDKEPMTRALVGIGYVLLALAQMTMEEEPEEVTSP